MEIKRLTKKTAGSSCLDLFDASAYGEKGLP